MEELLKKLRYKQGRGTVLAGPEGFRLGIEGEGQTEGRFDFVLLFVNNAQETEEWLPKVVPMLNEDALFWITYPKQSSKVKTDINRDILAAMVQDRTEYRAVSNVALDDKWSALRFRPKDKVKASK